MACNTDFVQYIVDQCSGAGEITVRKMMGDYCIYCNGIIFGLICDNKFYVKVTEAGRGVLKEVDLRPPYDGAKDYFYIADVDDHDYLSTLVRVTLAELPAPKERGKRRAKRLSSFLLPLIITFLFVGCGQNPDGNYAPVVCEALSQYEYWAGFNYTTDGHVLLMFDGNRTGLPDSLGGWPVEYVDSTWLQQWSGSDWPHVYELQLVFSDARHFDVLVYEHYTSRLAGGKAWWHCWPAKPPLPMARGVWNSRKGWTISTPSDLLLARERPRACGGERDSVMVAALYDVHDSDWVWIRDTTTLRGRRYWPCSTDSMALAEARRSELYLCMALHDTLLVVSNLPGIKSLNAWTRTLTEADIEGLFPAGFQLMRSEPGECGEDDCCCGPSYMTVYGSEDTVLFEGGRGSLYELQSMRLMTDGVSFAGLHVGLAIDSVAALMVLPTMDYSGYQCMVVVEPSELYAAWYGPTSHWMNQDPNVAQAPVALLVLEIGNGRVSQIRLNLDRFERGVWRCAERGIESWY